MIYYLYYPICCTINVRKLALPIFPFWICWVDRESSFENSPDIPKKIQKTENFMKPKHCKACSSRNLSWNLDMFWIICNCRYLLSIFHDVPFSYIMLCELTTMKPCFNSTGQRPFEADRFRLREVLGSKSKHDTGRAGRGGGCGGGRFWVPENWKIPCCREDDFKQNRGYAIHSDIQKSHRNSFLTRVPLGVTDLKKW